MVAFRRMNIAARVRVADARRGCGLLDADDAEFRASGGSRTTATLSAGPHPAGGQLRCQVPWRRIGPASVPDRWAQVDGVWDDEPYIEATNPQISEQDACLVWNARLSCTSGNDAWALAGWVKNAGDEVNRLYNLDLGLLGTSEELYAPPRWHGAAVTYRF